VSPELVDKETVMGYRINHIHLKSPDPRKTAEWYVKAFDFEIVSDETRVFGDRFVRCKSADGGVNVNISGARTNERLGPGDASPHHGLEHFGFDSADVDADIKRLTGLGARLLEGPIQIPNGSRIAFLQGPDDTRLELVQARKIAGGSGQCC
jgi:lactoylglutathione lyase